MTRREASIAASFLTAGAVLVGAVSLRQLRAQDTPLEFTYTQPARTVLNRDGGPWNHVDIVKLTAAQLGDHIVKYPNSTFTLGPLRLIHTPVCLNGVGTSFSECPSTNPDPTPLSDVDVAKIDGYLQKAEDARVKIILRFIYNDGPSDSSADDSSSTNDSSTKGCDFKADGQDAPMSVILQDIHRLAPIVNKHKNIIYAMNMGFIGLWGEGHNSSCGNNTPAKTKQFMEAEEAEFGPYVMLQNRYPSNILDWEPRGKVIWGIHDDHYATGATDSHTWQPAQWALYPYALNTLQHFAEGRDDQRPFSGEFGTTDVLNPEGETLSEYSQRFHLNSLSCAFHTDEIVKDQQNFTDFLNRVGPAIGLTHAALDIAPGPGASSKLTLSFLNTGFSRLFVSVPVYLVMTDANGNQLGSDVFKPIPVPIDLTQIASNGGEQTVSVTIQFPVDLARHTTYYAALRMPDPDTTLGGMYEYNYLLNNKDVPNESTGLNQLFPVQFQ